MAIKVDKILGRVRDQDKGFTYSARKRKNTTNAYLKIENTFMNIVPILIPEDMILDSISVSTDGDETWTAEIHDNGVPIPGASLNVVSSSHEYVKNLNISLTAGAKLMFYVNGSKINSPSITINCKI